MSRLDFPVENATSYRIEISERAVGAEASRLKKAAHDAGIDHLEVCQVARLYFLFGPLPPKAVEQFSYQVLPDPVTQHIAIFQDRDVVSSVTGYTHTIDVALLAGVTDSVAENLLRTAKTLGLQGLERAATGYRYYLSGPLDERDLQCLAVEILSNPVIQQYQIDQPITAPFSPDNQPDNTVEQIPLLSADDHELVSISAARRLALDLKEMQAIQAYFQAERREPTDAEIEMIAQTWSEHCSHKSFNALIDFTYGSDGQESYHLIDGLLRSTIRAATEKVNKPWVRSAFIDNAGIISLDDKWDLAFKVETHNHPSALEPFGGANTGVGGVIRDVLGVSARPIANTDVLCFGPPDLPRQELLSGALSPNRIAEGVISGVEDYGNKMGIPTVNGAILYHKGYTANPLVFCGCVGILPHGSHATDPEPGDLVIVLGGRTGRDGLRGATFSSMELDRLTSQMAGSAVQIGHPINEKQVQEVVLRARDEHLYHAITDCGAGGLSSAVGEMARSCGAQVQLDSIPLKYPGLRPWEIWLSEAQERMVLAVPPERWSRFQEICAQQDAEAVCIGTFGSNGRLSLRYGNQIVGDLSMSFLHDGMPRRQLKAIWNAHPSQPQSLSFAEPPDLNKTLLALLAHPNIRSKEPVIRRYDHEVQGATAIKPLVGRGNHGPGDAAVLAPLETVKPGANLPQQGVVLSAGICPSYGELDPYVMAWAAVDEAFRNAVAVGADPDRIALLDNFCWGDPNSPERMGELVRCAQGCHDAAIAYNAPFISGKDSLNNEYADETGRRRAIPGTLLISALGILPDIERAVTMDLKAPGNLLYLVGETSAEMGGSHYALMNADTGGIPPQPVNDALDKLRVMHRAIASGLVQSCHDCSEGGLGVALAEMCIAGQLGANVALPMDSLGRSDVTLFSESLCRFVIEVQPANAQEFEALLAGVPWHRLGTVTELEVLQVKVDQRIVIHVAVTDLEESWQGVLAEHVEYVDNIINVDNVDNKINILKRERGAPDNSSNIKTQRRETPIHTTRVGPRRVIVLTAKGTNRDREAALACELAGAEPEIVGLNQLLSGERHLEDYHMLVVPGGFSYGDDLGAGTLLAINLQHRLGEGLSRFIAEGRPVLGICNGFQALLKAGLLPGESQGSERNVTLTYNRSGHFECRWVYLQPNPQSQCLFTAGLDEPIYCPVAHGEGRLAVADSATANTLWTQGLAPLTYVDSSGKAAEYPANPNGSVLSIAALCNPAGNVLGLMPHPEDHVFAWQHPRWQRGEKGLTGLRLFQNGVKYA